MEFGDLLERIFRPKLEKKAFNTDVEVNNVYAEASAWVSDSLTKPKEELEKQPYFLSPAEINTIELKLVEEKSQKILKKKKLKKHQKQQVGEGLGNIFQQKYRQIEEKLVKTKDLEGVAGIAEVIENYLEVVKGFAPKFIYQKTSFEELIDVCNKIRGKRPTALIMKPAKINI